MTQKYFQYKEDEFMEQLKKYVSDTYDEHYSSGEGFQLLDVLDSIDISCPFIKGNMFKYVYRLGVKGKYGTLNKGDYCLESVQKDCFKIIHYAMLYFHFYEKMCLSNVKDDPIGDNYLSLVTDSSHGDTE